MQKQKQIQGVIFDWAGTTVDFGCFAPVRAFREAFLAVAKLEVTTDEIRQPMGMAKREHIRTMLGMARIETEFETIHGRDWNEVDVDRIYESFEKHLFATLQNYAEPIDGVIEVVEHLRKEGFRIGSTTGYTRAMMDVVEPAARAKGYAPDACVTPDGLPAGRPAPFMIYRNMMALDLRDPERIVKVGDTLEDIREGCAAGVWSVGVIIGSSEMALTREETAALSPEALEREVARVRKAMIDAGAHYTILTIDELPEVIERINNDGN